jgi:hypothetical protein
MGKCIQQNAMSHNLFISGSCSTCFGWYFHPSSGAHTTVSTSSGIFHTVTAICRYRGWKYHPKHVQQFPDINKLCDVASCWIYEYIGILLRARPILHISRIKVNWTLLTLCLHLLTIWHVQSVSLLTLTHWLRPSSILTHSVYTKTTRRSTDVLAIVTHRVSRAQT